MTSGVEMTMDKITLPELPEPLPAAPQPQAAPQAPPQKYAVDPIRADESLALAEKIMDRVVATGSAYLKLELVDPTAPQPQAPSATSDDVRDAKLYDELIYAVGKKWPGETRHETALRYIRQAETPTGEADQAKDSK